MYVYVCVCISMHAHVYACICMYVFQPKSLYVCIHMCMYRMYRMYEHVCCLHCMYWPRQVLMLSQQAQNTPRLGGNQRALLSTPMGSSPATLYSDQGPIPRPVFGALMRARVAGGGQSSPPAAPMGPPNALGTRLARSEPRSR